MAIGEASRIEGMMFKLGQYMARDLNTDDIALLNNFIISNKDFFETLTSNWAEEYNAENFLNMRPSGTKSEQRHLWGVFNGTELIAVIDLIANYPLKGSWSMGHFIIEKSYRLKGLGAHVYDRLKSYIINNSDCGSIRMVIQTSNTIAMQFWKRKGFETVKFVQQEIAGTYHEAAVIESRFI